MEDTPKGVDGITNEATKSCQVCGYITREWHQLILSKDGGIEVDAILCGDHTDRLIEHVEDRVQPEGA